MRRTARLLVLCVAAAFTASCATLPPVVTKANSCNFKLAKAEVKAPPLPRSPFLESRQPDNAMLLLSGGSQHGAFGAGLLARWKQVSGGRLPRFRTVTGVGTGALLSTDAFIDRPEAAELAYTIDREADLLKPYASRNKRGAFGLPDYVSIARNNAVADLAPLRARLREHLDMETLRKVRDLSDGRRLLVGAVDVDSGDAVVFDMVDMAKRAVETPGAEGERYRDCYVDAVLASSSVPLAAKPVVIDNRMYIDGGARFGVFVDGFGKEAGVGDKRDAAPAPQLYIVINGMQRVSPECGKLEGGGGTCAPDGSDGYLNRDGQHRSSNLLRACAAVERHPDRADLPLLGRRHRRALRRAVSRRRRPCPLSSDRRGPHAQARLERGRLRRMAPPRQGRAPAAVLPTLYALPYRLREDYADERAGELKLASTPLPAGLRGLDVQ
ncbi:patatin-like phospholipase family protein [Sphingomonas sp. MMS24-JH45]